MRAEASSDFERAWRRQSQRVTRRRLPCVMGFQPVPSQSGQASGRGELAKLRFMISFSFPLSTVLRGAAECKGRGWHDCAEAVEEWRKLWEAQARPRGRGRPRHTSLAPLARSGGARWCGVTRRVLGSTWEAHFY